MKTILFGAMLLSLSGCAVLKSVDQATLQAHADAVKDITDENTKYITADPTLNDVQKGIRTARNRDTSTFAAKLVEAK